MPLQIKARIAAPSDSASARRVGARSFLADAEAVCPGILSENREKYPTRVAIEHCFARLKENKTPALRFDKLDGICFSFFRLRLFENF
jgi:hypothetical protein